MDGGAVGPSLVRRCDEVLERCGVMASTRPRSMFSTKHLASDLEKLVKVGGPLSRLVQTLCMIHVQHPKHLASDLEKLVKVGGSFCRLVCCV